MKKGDCYVTCNSIMVVASDVDDYRVTALCVGRETGRFFSSHIRYSNLSAWIIAGVCTKGTKRDKRKVAKAMKKELGL